MVEELQKRFTDCVYFLASPLTCKNGADCEYRHSDIARLNPRDCWYWLAGGCLNPTCAFRHPPLEVRSETSSQSAPLNLSTAVSVSKTGVPCYFFYNGFCNKGDKCSFLHGPDDNLQTWKSTTATSVNPDGPLVEKKTSVGSDTGSTPVDTRTNLVDTGGQWPAGIKNESELGVHPSALNNVAKQNGSPQISGSPHEDAAGSKLNSLLATTGSVQRLSHASTDESSEDAVDGNVDREEWLESSPGFDVLVDDRSEELGYEDDHEYLLRHDREGRELTGQYLKYDFECNAEYDSAYPVNGYDNLAAEHIHEDVRGARAHSRESAFGRIFPPYRNLLPIDFSSSGQHGRDLRDLLQRRRTDGCSGNHSSRRHEASRRVSRNSERPRSRGGQWSHGRRATTYEMSFDGSGVDNEAFISVANRESRSRRSPIKNYRRSYIERSHGRPQLIMSEVSVKSASRKRNYPEEFTTFSGPKSLGQIKEDKKRAKGNSDFSERVVSLGRHGEDSFEGPKSLGEILKDKRRLVTVVDGNGQALSS